MSTTISGRPPEQNRVSWTLRRRLGLALLVSAVVLATILTIAFTATARVRNHQEMVTRDYYATVATVNASYQRLSSAQSSMRGYALTGDESLLPAVSALREARVVITLDDFPAPVRAEIGHVVAPLIASANAGVGRWLDEFAVPVVDRVDASGLVPLAPEYFVDGQVVFDEVRDDVDAIMGIVNDARSAEAGELVAETRTLVLTFLFLALSTVVIGAIVWNRLRRWIIDPLQVLAASVRRVRDGEVDARIGTDGPDEIGELAADVEDLRITLVGQLRRNDEDRAELVRANEQLVQQSEELARSNRDLEQFAYVASHDLQEPLRKVASFTQLLRKRYSGQLDDRADQYIEFAVDGAHRMQRLIQDLLLFSRVGRTPAGSTEPVALDECLSGALANLGEVIEETGAEIAHDPLPTVVGEAGLLTQLFQNLVGNAVKFRQPDEPPRVRITVQQDGDEWLFACQDNGIGIDRQYAERVFVIFQRLHAKDEYAGTGIGLALCKRIVEFHGGRIWLDEDSESQGATIRWSLPAGTGSHKNEGVER